ncbi:hypothetical protein BDY17DRAFT_294228 [Neohortaea acidophila]|uniref:Uncharacterized protein n=1 Tax=Neohortaea acidophila TaxID=245834 RepID=A0A6A6Q051_9PEZI|nr:uncharacterized protein BDY17DRAFT_294228 [Neohortaea acidophila]KAF2485780.1 hypothetical protein BDY17DRAFT_294228 [Neohortaea acidophila]
MTQSLRRVLRCTPESVALLSNGIHHVFSFLLRLVLLLFLLRLLGLQILIAPCYKFPEHLIDLLYSRLYSLDPVVLLINGILRFFFLNGCVPRSWRGGWAISRREGWSIWRDGFSVSWSPGVSVVWRGGVVVSWSDGFSVVWRGRVVVSGCGGVSVSWSGGVSKCWKGGCIPKCSGATVWFIWRAGCVLWRAGCVLWRARCVQWRAGCIQGRT